MSYVLTTAKRHAFIVSLPKNEIEEKNRVLDHKILNMGWEEAEGLTKKNICYEDFREIIHNHYFPNDKNLYRAGRIAGNAWRFIKKMNIGNYILLPSDDGFYLAIITSPVYFDNHYTGEKRGYKRTIRLLNDGNIISNENIPLELQEKLNPTHRVTDVSDLLQEVEYSLRASKSH